MTDDDEPPEKGAPPEAHFRWRQNVPTLTKVPGSTLHVKRMTLLLSRLAEINQALALAVFTNPRAATHLLKPVEFWLRAAGWLEQVLRSRRDFE
jgi:hypothetical protein